MKRYGICDLAPETESDHHHVRRRDVLAIRKQLKAALNSVPPVNGSDLNRGGKNIKDRKTHPNWPRLENLD